MTPRNPVREKSSAFALRIVHCSLRIQREKKEYVLTKQLLKSGTSIGANLEEAQQAHSRKEFAQKCAISLKEAYESRYWLWLMRDAHLMTKEETESLLKNLHEIICLLVSIVRTSKIPHNSH